MATINQHLQIFEHRIADDQAKGLLFSQYIIQIRVVNGVLEQTELDQLQELKNQLSIRGYRVSDWRDLDGPESEIGQLLGYRHFAIIAILKAGNEHIFEGFEFS